MAIVADEYCANKAIIGLTGGIGSGKSAAAARFAKHGIVVVDTDVIAHQLTAASGSALPDIVACFGNEVLATDGAMDRVAMRKRVFADPKERAWLQAILHPMIYQQSLSELQQARSPYAILMVPLLFEYPYYRQVLVRTLVIDCAESQQLSRVMQRHSMTESQVQAIIATQLSRTQRNALADDVIENNGSLDDLTLQVDEKHRYYLENLTKALFKP